ncbi:MAG: hypothetical protein PHE04_08450 [Bacteroidales bacterium]|nr:hypothetical protein [Bacteroidales bacterium]
MKEIIFTKHQQEIASKIDREAGKEQWTDWKWQTRHSIKTIEDFEHLTDISFKEEDKRQLNETRNRFPLSITPYYLSLINKDNYINDPVYKQAFLDNRELIVTASEMGDPLSEDHDSPVPGITHRYPDRVLFL